MGSAIAPFDQPLALRHDEAGTARATAACTPTYRRAIIVRRRASAERDQFLAMLSHSYTR